MSEVVVQPITLGVDRSSPIPLYFQLRKTIEAGITSGRWDEQLPSEPQLCELFAVSRTTVRQALHELEADGVLRRVKGRGTFITDTGSQSGVLQSSLGFFEDAARKGQRVTSRVLRAEEAPLPDWAADALRLPRGSRGVTLHRVRSCDGAVAHYAENHLPRELAGAVLAADLTSRSLYGLLRDELGITLTHADRQIGAVAATPELVGLLDVPPGAPLVLVESVGRTADGRSMECYRAWHRSDRSRLSVRVTTIDEDG